MALTVVASAMASDRFRPRSLIMVTCVGAVAWSLMLFPLPDTHSIGAVIITGPSEAKPDGDSQALLSGASSKGK
jgi:hypothetical protein